MSSADYDDKIQKLLEEGRRLGTPVPPSLSASDDHRVSSATARSSIISAAAKTYDLQAELDMQEKETAALQGRLKQAHEHIMQAQLNSHHITNSNHNNNNNSVRDVSSVGSIARSSVGSIARSAVDLRSASTAALEQVKSKHVEVALENAQLEVERLTRKLNEANEQHSKQKDHFRSAIEELQVKLHDTIVGRRHLVELREHDMREQEDMIERLQTTVKELAASNQMQEQSLLDAYERLQIIENKNQANEQALSDVRELLKSSQDASGDKNASNLGELAPGLLVQTLRSFIQNSTQQADSLSRKLLQLEADHNAAKQSHEAEKLLVTSDASDAVKSLEDKHQHAMNVARGEADKAARQIDKLSTRLQELESERTLQSRLSDQQSKEIAALTSQLDATRKQLCAETGDLQSRLVSCGYDLKLAQDRADRLHDENEANKKSMAELHERLERSAGETAEEREQRRAIWMRQTEYEKEMNDLRYQSEEKTMEVSRLREIVAQLRGELTTRVAEKVNDAETAVRNKAEEKLDQLQAENARLRDELTSVRTRFESQELHLSQALVERTEAAGKMQEKDQQTVASIRKKCTQVYSTSDKKAQRLERSNRQIERLNQQLTATERHRIELDEAKKADDVTIDRLQREVDEATRATRRAQSDVDKSRSRDEERERHVTQLRNQLDKKSSELTSCKSELDARAEKLDKFQAEATDRCCELARISALLHEKQAAAEEVESRMSGMREEKEKLSEQLLRVRDRCDSVEQSRLGVESELNEARLQISHLVRERDEAARKLVPLQTRYSEDVEKLRTELARKKRELQHAQETVRAVRGTDGCAAQVAADMQSEVTSKRSIIDQLQSELAKSYDKLEITEREVKKMRKDTARLEKKVTCLTSTNHKLDRELREKTKSEKGYRLAVDKLQAALEKAAVRNTEAQSVINQQDEKISRAQIQHNLLMMDRRSTASVWQPTPPTGGVAVANNFGRPTPAPPANSSLQNSLVRLLLNMTTKPREGATDPKAGNDVMAMTSSRPPTSIEPRANSDGDLKQILTELRDLITSAREIPNTGGGREKRDESAPTSSGRSSEARLSALDDVTISYVSADVTPTIENVCYVAGGTMTSSSPLPVDDYDVMKEGEVRSSPVSILLAAGDASSAIMRETDRLPTARRPLTTTNLPNRGDEVMTPERDSGSSRLTFDPHEMKDDISSNAEELCRQLHTRLEGLSQMGSQLERHNKAAGNLIKKQDRKLRRVRESGQKLR